MFSVPWILSTLTTLAVGTRFYMQKKQAISLASDDWVMLGALVFQIGHQAILTIACSKGASKSIDPTMPVEDMVEMLRWSYFTQLMSFLVGVVARISITILLVRIFGVRTWYKWFMITFTLFLSVIGLTNIIIIWFMARPVEALWDFRIGTEYLDLRITEGLSTALHC